MKKIMSTCLLAAVLLGLAACGGEGAGELELTVFAAASMTEALAEIKAAYEAFEERLLGYELRLTALVMEMLLLLLEHREEGGTPPRSTRRVWPRLCK